MNKRKKFVAILAGIMAAIMVLTLILSLIPHAMAASSSEIRNQINDLKTQQSEIQQQIEDVKKQYQENENEIANIVKKRKLSIRKSDCCTSRSRLLTSSFGDLIF